MNVSDRSFLDNFNGLNVGRKRATPDNDTVVKVWIEKAEIKASESFGGNERFYSVQDTYIFGEFVFDHFDMLAEI